MKTLEQINERIQWILKALNDEENQDNITQVKLYTQLDILNWIKGE